MEGDILAAKDMGVGDAEIVFVDLGERNLGLHFCDSFFYPFNTFLFALVFWSVLIAFLSSFMFSLRWSWYISAVPFM